MSADLHGWATAHTAPDEDFEEGLADAVLYIDDNMVCECCGVIYCLHNNVVWISPKLWPGRADITWTNEEDEPDPNPGARCNDCGMTATLTQMEAAADGFKF